MLLKYNKKNRSYDVFSESGEGQQSLSDWLLFNMCGLLKYKAEKHGKWQHTIAKVWYFCSTMKWNSLDSMLPCGQVLQEQYRKCLCDSIYKNMTSLITVGVCSYIFQSHYSRYISSLWSSASSIIEWLFWHFGRQICLLSCQVRWDEHYHSHLYGKYLVWACRWLTLNCSENLLKKTEMYKQIVV